MVQMLEREKHILQGQLRDLEWRLDQESKVPPAPASPL